MIPFSDSGRLIPFSFGSIYSRSVMVPYKFMPWARFEPPSTDDNSYEADALPNKPPRLVKLDICFDSLWNTKQNIFFVLYFYLNWITKNLLVSRMEMALYRFTLKFNLFVFLTLYQQQHKSYLSIIRSIYTQLHSAWWSALFPIFFTHDWVKQQIYSNT